MSEDMGVFRKHRKKIWIFTGLLIVASVAIYGFISGIFPDVSFLWSPIMLAFYGGSTVLLVFGYALYRYRSGGSFMGSRNGGSTDVDKQLTKKEAKKLAEWDLFNRDDPIMVGREKRCNVKPVTNKDEGTSIRVFEWVFEGRDTSETYAYQMSLDQDIHFETEWIDMMTPENLELLNEAVNDIQNPALERKSHVDDWRERLQQNREEIGQAVRSRNAIEELSNHPNVKKVITENPERGQTLNKQEEE